MLIENCWSLQRIQQTSPGFRRRGESGCNIVLWMNIWPIESQKEVYEIRVERSVEKDLAKLAVGVHDRIIEAMRFLANNPRPHGCRKLAGSKMTGEFVWGIIESFTKL